MLGGAVPTPHPKKPSAWGPVDNWRASEHRYTAPDGCAWIRARYDSQRIFCRKPVKQGEQVMWEKGSGVIHEACWPAAAARAGVAV